MLRENTIVLLRNGNYGAVASFNGKPFQIIFTAYTNPIARYNLETLKHKNPQYDIVKVFDGSPLENVTDVFKRKFTAENLPVVWEEPANE